MKAYKFKKKNKKHGATTAMLKNKGHNQSAPSRTSEENKNKKRTNQDQRTGSNITTPSLPAAYTFPSY